MGDSKSDQPNWWQSIKQFLKAHLLTEIVIGVISLVLAATLFPGAFGGLRLVIGLLWLMVSIVVLILILIAHALLCFWGFVSGDNADESNGEEV